MQLTNTLRSFFTVFLVVAAMSIGSHSAMAETEEEYQQRIKALAESIQQLKAELNSAKSSKDNLQKSLQTSEEEIGKLSKKVESIKEALAREKKRLSQLQSKRSELEQQSQQQQQHIRYALRQSYVLGQQSHIKLLLNQEHPERIGRLMHYHNYMVGAQQQQIAQYQATLDELNLIEPKIVVTTHQLEQNQKALTQRQKALKGTQKKRLTTLKKLTSSLGQKGKQLSKLTSDRRRLQNLLDEVTNALSNLELPNDASPFSSIRGKLPMPTQGKIIHRYGSTQFDGKLKRQGIVIKNRAGAKVVSVHHGRVIFSDYLRGHGLLLIIDHGDGYMSLYGHNQTLLKEIGDWIQTGETIATVGNSGGQSQAALYFEIRHQGQPQNPQRWLARG